MEVHEVCKMFPEMSRADLGELMSDIARHGVIEPIWTYQGQIIDGRHRYRAACALGKNFETREWNGECGSILAFVTAQNLTRRHLNAVQRAALAAELKPRIQEEIRERHQEACRKADAARRADRRAERASERVTKLGNGQSASPRRNAQAEAAALCGVSKGYLSDAEHIKEASPETFEEMKAGRLSMADAKRKALPPPVASNGTATLLSLDDDHDKGNIEPQPDAAVAPERFVASEQWCKVKDFLDESLASWPRESWAEFLRNCMQWSKDTAGEKPRLAIVDEGSPENAAYLESIPIRGKVRPHRIDDDAMIYLHLGPILAVLRHSLETNFGSMASYFYGPFRAAVANLVKTLPPEHWEVCDSCKGQGHPEGEPTKKCRKCKEAGYLIPAS